MNSKITLFPKTLTEIAPPTLKIGGTNSSKYRYGESEFTSFPKSMFQLLVYANIQPKKTKMLKTIIKLRIESGPEPPK
jgi:hypothetical protein